MFYVTIFADILRICRTTSSYNDFLSDVHRIISHMKKGTEIDNIIKALSKMMFRLTEELLKFNVKQEDIIRGITS